MLTAIDLDFLARDVACRIRAQKEHHARDFVRGSNTPHRNNGYKSRFGIGRQNVGPDLARRNGIDPNSVWRKVMRHLARQTGECAFEVA